MTHQIIEAAYNGLKKRLHLNTWKTVPKELACMALASIYSEREIREALGFFVSSEVMYYSYMQQISATVAEVKTKFKLTGLQAA